MAAFSLSRSAFIRRANRHISGQRLLKVRKKNSREEDKSSGVRIILKLRLGNSLGNSAYQIHRGFLVEVQVIDYQSQELSGAFSFDLG